METIKNAIWGSNDPNEDQATPPCQQEPLSGAAGDVSKGEPYDAGNMTPQTEQHDQSPAPQHQQPTSSMPQDEEPTQSPAPRQQQPTGGMHSDPPSRSPGLMDDKETSTSNQPGPTTDDGAGDGAADPEEIDPKDLALDGPGPRPIEEVSRENGGHMPEHETPMTRGVSFSSSNSNEESGDATSSVKESTEVRSDTSHEHVEDHRDDSKDPKLMRGTSAATPNSAADHPMNQDGTHPHTDDYISSGMACDGGNFDVTKPGAGKEAQRLIHQGAVRHTVDENKQKKYSFPLKKRTANGSGESADNGRSSNSAQRNGEGQQGLSEKLKNKLHIKNH